jgi:hypothetical protein
MIERDRTGRVRAIRSVRTSIHGVMLIDEAWRENAADELLRLELEAANLLRQMEERGDSDDLDVAVTALKKARTALQADGARDRVPR